MRADSAGEGSGHLHVREAPGTESRSEGEDGKGLWGVSSERAGRAQGRREEVGRQPEGKNKAVNTLRLQGGGGDKQQCQRLRINGRRALGIRRPGIGGGRVLQGAADVMGHKGRCQVGSGGKRVEEGQEGDLVFREQSPDRAGWSEGGVEMGEAWEEGMGWHLGEREAGPCGVGREDDSGEGFTGWGESGATPLMVEQVGALPWSEDDEEGGAGVGSSGLYQIGRHNWAEEGGCNSGSSGGLLLAGGRRRATH
ncbi:hypothetical protein NDU88_002546 [Pleurodeles waltl]|uniref:Uncharacterized protein n=1 Tax=Pleurodeles waltl TaxID=8319 RepID=A0AAV7SDJ2_PLEWA|nr:hypothetical protein NDU88_002546 [Pleurodeles waltl]